MPSLNTIIDNLQGRSSRYDERHSVLEALHYAKSASIMDETRYRKAYNMWASNAFLDASRLLLPDDCSIALIIDSSGNTMCRLSTMGPTGQVHVEANSPSPAGAVGAAALKIGAIYIEILDENPSY